MARGRNLFGALLTLTLLPAAAGATRSFEFEGTVPSTSVDVKFTAELTISGDDLTLVLANDSLNHTNGPSPTLNPADLLTSFYFDIFDGVNRPTLTYTGASGDVCLGSQGGADDCSVTTNEADLRALVVGAYTWQFKDSFSTSPGWTGPLLIGSDELHFGVGTAGNSSLSPNGFNGNYVGGLDYGIYAGDVSTNNLDGDLLVNGSITFRWTGVSGYSEDDIGGAALFGLGTQPDSTALVPEPGSALLFGLGMVILAARRRR